MAALQCEICGGKLMGSPGGIFECDSCGKVCSPAGAAKSWKMLLPTSKES